MVRVLSDGKRLSQGKDNSDTRIDPQPIIKKLTEENQQHAIAVKELKEKLISCGENNSALSDKIRELESGATKSQVAQVDIIEIRREYGVILKLKEMSGTYFSLVAKYGAKNTFDLYRYDLSTGKESEPWKTNPATELFLYKNLFEKLAESAATHQENSALISNLSGDKNRLERDVAQLTQNLEQKQKDDTQYEEQNKRIIHLTEELKQHEQNVEKLASLREELDGETLTRKSLFNVVLGLEGLLDLAGKFVLEKNGFVADYVRGGKNVKILITEDGAHYVDGDNLEALSEDDPANKLSEIFGKHYAAITTQESSLRSELQHVIDKEIEVLKTLGVKDGDVNLGQYESPYDAALSLLGKIKSNFDARTQSRAKFMKSLHTYLEKMANDFGLSKDVVAAYNLKWGTDSLAATAHIIEAVKTAHVPVGMVHQTALRFQEIIKCINADLIGLLADKSDEYIINAGTALLIKYVKTKNEEIENTKAAQQNLQKLLVDYISKLSGLPVDVSSLDDNASNLQDLLNSAIKKKRTEWQFGILQEIYTKLPVEYKTGLPEGAELGVGIDRLARDIERLASDAQTGKENVAALNSTKEIALQLQGYLNVEKEKTRQLEARVEEAKAGSKVIGDMFSKSGNDREIYDQLLQAKDSKIKELSGVLTEKDGKLNTYELQMSEKDKQLAEQEKQLNEREQQIQATKQELQAIKAQEAAEPLQAKPPVPQPTAIKKVKKVVKKLDDEAAPEIELEETEQLPPAELPP